MGGHNHGGMDSDRNLRLSPAQDASNDFVQGRARPEQELGLESPDRHLDERAPIGYETYTSAHTRAKDGKSGANVISESMQYYSQIQRNRLALFFWLHR